MQDAPRITPFEGQVLEAMLAAYVSKRQSYLWTHKRQPLTDADWESGEQASTLEFIGVSLWGAGWAGNPVYPPTTCNFVLYPQINLALGRLATKGLVERMEWASNFNPRFTVGKWKLTDEGKLLVGFDGVAPGRWYRYQRAGRTFQGGMRSIRRMVQTCDW